MEHQIVEVALRLTNCGTADYDDIREADTSSQKNCGVDSEAENCVENINDCGAENCEGEKSYGDDNEDHEVDMTGIVSRVVQAGGLTEPFIERDNKQLMLVTQELQHGNKNLRMRMETNVIEIDGDNVNDEEENGSLNLCDFRKMPEKAPGRPQESKTGGKVENDDWNNYEETN